MRRHLADLTPDYTLTPYPDAANAVPYELYDEATARKKVTQAEEVLAWLRSRIRGQRASCVTTCPACASASLR